MMLEMTLNVAVFIVMSVIVLALLVLKYGQVTTKLLFIIHSFLTTGLFLLQWHYYVGALLVVFGSLLAGYYTVKAIKDFVSSF